MNLTFYTASLTFDVHFSLSFLEKPERFKILTFLEFAFISVSSIALKRCLCNYFIPVGRGRTANFRVIDFSSEQQSW